MLPVQLVEHLLRLREVFRVPGELAVVRIPARGDEVGAEIDERIARQLLLAELARDAHDLIGPAQVAVRLHVTEGPASGELGESRDARILAHDDQRIRGRDHEEIHRQSRFGLRSHLPFFPGEVERAGGLIDEDRPAVGADQPLRRYARAVCRQSIRARPFGLRALTVAHRVDRTLAVELRTAFAEAEQRAARQEKRQSWFRHVEREALYHLPVECLHVDGGRIFREADYEIARTQPREVRALRAATEQRARLLLHQRTGGRDADGFLAVRESLQRTHRDAQRDGTERPHGDVDRLAGNENGAAPAAEGTGKHDTGSGHAELLERVATRDAAREGHVTSR